MSPPVPRGRVVPALRGVVDFLPLTSPVVDEGDGVAEIAVEKAAGHGRLLVPLGGAQVAGER